MLVNHLISKHKIVIKTENKENLLYAKSEDDYLSLTLDSTIRYIEQSSNMIIVKLLELLNVKISDKLLSFIYDLKILDDMYLEFKLRKSITFQACKVQTVKLSDFYRDYRDTKLNKVCDKTHEVIALSFKYDFKLSKYTYHYLTSLLRDLVKQQTYRYRVNDTLRRYALIDRLIEFLKNK
jgi:hypothetical protein